MALSLRQETPNCRRWSFCYRCKLALFHFYASETKGGKRVTLRCCAFSASFSSFSGKAPLISTISIVSFGVFRRVHQSSVFGPSGYFIIAARVVEEHMCEQRPDRISAENTVRMTCSNGTKFLPSEAVSQRRHGLYDLQLIQTGRNVVDQRRGVTVLVSWTSGSASRNGIVIMHEWTQAKKCPEYAQSYRARRKTIGERPVRPVPTLRVRFPWSAVDHFSVSRGQGCAKDVC